MIHSARWYFEVAYKSSLQLIVSVIMGSSFDQALIFRFVLFPRLQNKEGRRTA